MIQPLIADMNAMQSKERIVTTCFQEELNQN